MVKERDESSGKYTQAVTDEEILEYVRERGGVPTSDVAEHFDYERPSAYRRLKSLEDDDRVESRQIGNSLLWEAREQRQTPAEEPADPPPVEQTRPAEPAHTRREQSERERAEERIRELDDVLEGDETMFEIRLEAVLSIYDHLRDADSGRRKSGLEEFIDENDIDTGFQSGFAGLWSNWVKADSGKGRPNLLTELPDVELRGGYYTYTDGENE